jgi:biopolymer transport protein ExbB/TolQ
MSTRTYSIAGIIAGAVLMLAPLCGLAGTLLGMLATFGEVAQQNQSNPEALTQGVEMAMLSTIAGLALFAAGAVLLVMSLVAYLRGK